MKPTLKDAIWLLLLFAVIFYVQFTKPSIAYVRSEILVNEFAGMKEAREAYQKKQQQWQANLDTLQAEYQRKEKADVAMVELQATAQDLQRYVAAVEQLSQEEDQKMTQSVLEQINVFVEQYGKDHGYDLILGTTTSGSILYGNQGIDITEELLEALNKYYNPGSYGH